MRNETRDGEMEQEKLKKILEKHRLWLNDEEGGERANLQRANLRKVDLREANLQEANLQGADLQGANLQEANLQGADLREVDLQGADLRWANLQGANLREVALIHIKAPIWDIYINSKTTQIGCETHKNEEWRDFDDERIAKMDSKALEWWRVYKPVVVVAMNAVMLEDEKNFGEGK